MSPPSFLKKPPNIRLKFSLAKYAPLEKSKLPETYPTQRLTPPLNYNKKQTIISQKKFHRRLSQKKCQRQNIQSPRKVIGKTSETEFSFGV